MPSPVSLPFLSTSKHHHRQAKCKEHRVGEELKLFIEEQRQETIVQQRRRAPITESNFLNSPLCRLPTELLYQVDNQLAAGGAIALRAVCLQLRTALHPRRRTRVLEKSAAGKRQFHNLMRHEAFGKICQAERERSGLLSQITKRKTAACRACLTTHPVEYFSQQQLHHTAPEHRRCRGREKKLRLCSHHSCPYEEVRAMALPPVRDPDDKASESLATDSYYCVDHPSDDGMWFLKSDGPDHAYVLSRHTELPYQSTTWQPFSDVQHLLRNDHSSLCRHIRLSTLTPNPHADTHIRGPNHPLLHGACHDCGISFTMTWIRPWRAQTLVLDLTIVHRWTFQHGPLDWAWINLLESQHGDETDTETDTDNDDTKHPTPFPVRALEARKPDARQALFRAAHAALDHLGRIARRGRRPASNAVHQLPASRHAETSLQLPASRAAMLSKPSSVEQALQR